MRMRVTCPSCGRIGGAPAKAVGRTVRCPGCSLQYILTAEMMVAEEDGSDDAVPPWPTAMSRPESRPGREPDASEGSYEVEEAPIPRPARPTPPRPSPVPDREVADARPGFHVSTPAMAGGAIGVVLVTAVSVWAILGLSKGKGPVVADNPPPPLQAVAEATPTAPAPGPAPAPAPAASAPVPAPAPAVAIGEARPEASAPPSELAKAPEAPPGVAFGGEPAGPRGISVAELLGLAEPAARDRPTAPGPMPAAPEAPTVAREPEPATETEEARLARAGASAVAAREDVPGKVLSTAEIVEESEPSVALVKGNSSSGTGFLVAPGLLATNCHVIDDEFISDLEIRFVSADESRKAPLKAELLYEDPKRDLAFLAVKTDLKPLRVAKTYGFRKGEDITVIGSPGLGDGQVLENAISRGVMSTKMQLDGKNFYQLGIAINPGNSGGPVFDSQGRVIGVATLKSTKQESTGFSIPVEDLQLAIAKVGEQSAGESSRQRSRHRLLAAVKGLGGGGALMCLIIDLRRADAVVNSPAVKELLGKLEPVFAELDKDALPTLKAEASRVKNDAQVESPVKRMVGEMAENLAKIRAGYASWKTLDDKQLRAWKQAHKQLLTDLTAKLNIEVPDGLLSAFDDHSPSQRATIVTTGPPNLGSFSSRLRPRAPSGPSRPPSLRDRARGRLGR